MAVGQGILLVIYRTGSADTTRLLLLSTHHQSRRCGVFRKADGMKNGRDLASVLGELATHHAAAAALAKEAQDLVAGGRRPSRRPPVTVNGHTTRNGGLIVCSSMCAVQWRGRCCVLGPSLLLRLIYRLAQHPNRFFTYDMIMEEVWHRRSSDEALRALVCRLRRALVNSDMPDLAAAIRVRGRCVGLFLDNSSN